MFQKEQKLRGRKGENHNIPPNSLKHAAHGSTII